MLVQFTERRKCHIACICSAWLRQSGLSSCYSGQVEAVEYNSNEYLISFDRPGLGKHHIADIEVKVYLLVHASPQWHCIVTQFPIHIACIALEHGRIANIFHFRVGSGTAETMGSSNIKFWVRSPNLFKFF